MSLGQSLLIFPDSITTESNIEKLWEQKRLHIKEGFERATNSLLQYGSKCKSKGLISRFSKRMRAFLEKGGPDRKEG